MEVAPNYGLCRCKLRVRGGACIRHCRQHAAKHRRGEQGGLGPECPTHARACAEGVLRKDIYPPFMKANAYAFTCTLSEQAGIVRPALHPGRQLQALAVSVRSVPITALWPLMMGICADH